MYLQDRCLIMKLEKSNVKLKQQLAKEGERQRESTTLLKVAKQGERRLTKELTNATKEVNDLNKQLAESSRANEVVRRDFGEQREPETVDATVNAVLERLARQHSQPFAQQPSATFHLGAPFAQQQIWSQQVASASHDLVMAEKMRAIDAVRNTVFHPPPPGHFHHSPPPPPHPGNWFLIVTLSGGRPPWARLQLWQKSLASLLFNCARGLHPLTSRVLPLSLTVYFYPSVRARNPGISAGCRSP
jgi:hypothetical protein